MFSPTPSLKHRKQRSSRRNDASEPLRSGEAMTNLDADPTSPSAGEVHTKDSEQSVEMLGVVSIILSSLGFLTLLKLADRTDRSPARALGLFFATSCETIGGTITGLVAASRASESRQPGRACYSEPRGRCSVSSRPSWTSIV